MPKPLDTVSVRTLDASSLESLWRSKVCCPYVRSLTEVCAKISDDLVLLQGMKEEPPLDTRCKDKFLVLSVVVTADKDFSNIASIV